jgi:hypothetical protein
LTTIGKISGVISSDLIIAGAVPCGGEKARGAAKNRKKTNEKSGGGKEYIKVGVMPTSYNSRVTKLPAFESSVSCRAKSTPSVTLANAVNFATRQTLGAIFCARGKTKGNNARLKANEKIGFRHLLLKFRPLQPHRLWKRIGSGRSGLVKVRKYKVVMTQKLIHPVSKSLLFIKVRKIFRERAARRKNNRAQNTSAQHAKYAAAGRSRPWPFGHMPAELEEQTARHVGLSRRFAPSGLRRAV